MYYFPKCTRKKLKKEIDKNKIISKPLAKKANLRKIIIYIQLMQIQFVKIKVINIFLILFKNAIENNNNQNDRR